VFASLQPRRERRRLADLLDPGERQPAGTTTTSSSGAVAVARGRLVEHNLAIGVESVETEVTAGAVYGFGPDHIHRLTGRDAGSVSVHAYSPPLWRMGQYSVRADGVLRRVSVSYADELRPID
jgi:hypothetical protein